MTYISKLVYQVSVKPFFATCYLIDILNHFKTEKGENIYYEFWNNLET